MSTRTTGYEPNHMRTVATSKNDPVAKHKLSEGAAREPMYKSRSNYDGQREEVPADHSNEWEVSSNG